HPGTLIGGKKMLENAEICAVSHKDQQSLIELTSKPDQRAMAKALHYLWQQGVAPSFNTQWLKEDGSAVLQILVPQEKVNGLHAEVTKDEIKLSVKMQNLSCISVVGEGFLQAPEMVTQLFESVKVPVLFSDVANYSVSI